MENGFSNLSLTTSNQSISGSKDYKVQTLDFDTSCPCQITACDGGTIKVCGKIEFDPPPEYHGDICDFDSEAYLQGFVAKESFGYSLCKDTATCDDTGIENKALIGLPDPVSGFISTILQTESPGMTGTSASVAIFAPDAKTTITGGKCIDIVGGSGNNVDVNLQTGDPQGRLSVVSSRNMTLNCIGGNQPSTEGNLNIEASYGKIDIRATGLDPNAYSRSQNIDIISQQGDITITPKTPPAPPAYPGAPPVGYTYITGMVSTDQSIPVAPYSGPAGQIRICQDPAGNVYLYASTLQFITNAVQWSRILLV
jgi:hypothetical protein